MTNDLYESIEGKEHIQAQQQAIPESIHIKEQAFHNYQTGLREDIKLLLRVQRYSTLAAAITGAIAE